MSPNQHESVQRVARYARHVTELAVRYGVLLRVHRRRDGAKPHDAFAGLLSKKGSEPVPFDERLKLIYVPRVVDETTYAVSLHELGHHLHPLGYVDKREGSRSMREGGGPSDLRDVRLMLIAERSAWEWARENALEWTELMNHNSLQAFETYCAMGRKLGHKEAALWDGR